MARDRIVRFKYPNEFATLVQALALDLDRRKIASALQLPLSTVYRWISIPHERGNFERGWTQNKNDTLANEINALIRACESFGFEVEIHVNQLIPAVFGIPWHELKSLHKSRKYSFFGQFENKLIVGEVKFPHGANGNVEKTISILGEENHSICGDNNQKLLLAKMEIDQHYYTRLSCESLAKMVGMNRFRFIREFRILFGISPYQYVNQVRVDHAKHMLALTSHSLDLIATSVGFTSASSLARAFKRFAGLSPSNFLYKIAPANTTRRDIAA
jgi:AraC-like DNA-binding protein